MKRTELKRTAALKRGRVKTVNRKRRAAKYARNFGDEAEAVRAMRCVCNDGLCDEMKALQRRERHDEIEKLPVEQWCSGQIVAAHVTARGMGASKGGRFDLVPLCSSHHGEASEAGTSQREAFEERYGVDLRAEADRIATPALAKIARQRANNPDSVTGYDLEALLGWTGRALAKAEASDITIHQAQIIALSDGLSLHPADAFELGEIAGWPS